MLRVGVKYCGHCNPTVEGPDLVTKLITLGQDIIFVPWQDEKDILLVISGCASNCVECPKFDGPVIHVAGNYLEWVAYPLSELPAAILAKIRVKGDVRLVRSNDQLQKKDR